MVDDEMVDEIKRKVINHLTSLSHKIHRYYVLPISYYMSSLSSTILGLNLKNEMVDEMDEMGDETDILENFFPFFFNHLTTYHLISSHNLPS